MIEDKFEHNALNQTKRIKTEEVTGNKTRMKISCYNARGLKDNEYLNILTINHKIVFVSETGATNINEIQDQIGVKGYKVFNRNGVKTSKDGRGSPKGGLAFIVAEELNAKANMRINERIAALTVGTTTMIGVHFDFLNGPLSSLSLDNDLAVISNLIDDEKAKENDCVILGDFNIDMTRKNSHTQSLVEFLNESDFVLKDMKFDQNIQYTFNNHQGKHWIDHGTLNKNVVSITILDDDFNHSDHRAISILYDFHENNLNLIEKKRTRKQKINYE